MFSPFAVKLAARRAGVAALLGVAGAAAFGLQSLLPRPSGFTTAPFGGAALAHRVEPTVLLSDERRPVRVGAGSGAAVLVLGYTRCTDECPLTLATLARALRGTGARDGVRAFFVTTDPAYDTPAVLHRYLAVWNHRITGLTAPPAVVRGLEAQLGAGFGARAEHDTRLFVLDAGGDVAAELAPDAPVSEVREALGLR